MKNKSLKMVILSAFFVIAGNVYAQNMSPKFIRSGATDDPTTKKTITWITDQVGSPQAIMKIAKKTDGEGSFTEKTGKTMNYVYNSSTSGGGGTDVPRTAYSVTVDGLTPETTYIYQVGNGTNWSKTLEFTTTAATDKFLFYVLPDMQFYVDNKTTDVVGGTAWTRRVAKMYENPETKPMFTIQIGDLTDREHIWNYYRLFGEICDDYPKFGSTDMICAMGNHEYYYGIDGAHADAATMAARPRGNISKFLNGTPPTNHSNPATGTGTFYVDYGNVRVFTLDFAGRDNHPVSGTLLSGGYTSTQIINAQAEWLRENLKNCNKPWKIVSVHYPIFNHAMDTESDKQPFSLMETAFGPILDEFGVQLAFSGHYHYTRRIQVYGGATLAAGMVFQAGGGVVKHGGTTYITAGNLADNVASSSYIKCDVDGKKLTLTMTNQNGVVRDSFTIYATPEDMPSTSAEVTFESLNPEGGSLEAYTGGTICPAVIPRFSKSTALPAGSGTLSRSAKLESGQVQVRNGSVFFVATPKYGWRVQRFVVNGQSIALRSHAGAIYRLLNEDGSTVDNNTFIAAANNNSGVITNAMPGLVYGIATNDATGRTKPANPAEIIEIAVPADGNLDVCVEFEKELAAYSKISASNQAALNADKLNFHPSKYAVVCGPSEWHPGGGGEGEWIQFNFDKGKTQINELRLYTRSGNNRPTEVRIDFYFNGAIIEGKTLTKSLNAAAANLNSIKFEPVEADAVRITHTAVQAGGANWGYQRIQILESTTYAVTFDVENNHGTLSATVDETPITTGQQVQQGKDVVFTANPNSGYKVKEWKVNNTTVANNTTNSYTLQNLSEPTVVTVIFDPITGVENIFAPNLKIYSDPFTNALHIAGAKDCTLRVMDVAGVVVHVQKITEANEIVRLKQLAAGIYFFRVEKDGQTKTVKVVYNVLSRNMLTFFRVNTCT